MRSVLFGMYFSANVYDLIKFDLTWLGSSALQQTHSIHFGDGDVSIASASTAGAARMWTLFILTDNGIWLPDSKHW